MPGIIKRKKPMGTKWNHTDESKLKISQSRLGEKNPQYGKYGDLNPNFTGTHMLSFKKAAKRRDKFTCRMCGLTDHEIVEVDHLFAIRFRPELKLELKNMITLCPNCHARKTRRIDRKLTHEDILKLPRSYNGYWQRIKKMCD